MSPPPPQIVLFDFRKVIEVIFHDRSLERSKVRLQTETMGSNLCNLTSNLSPRFGRLRRGPRFRGGIRWLGRGGCLCNFWRGVAAEGLVPPPYYAQPLQG